MKQDISYCDRCLKEIEKHGKLTAEVYKKMCIEYANGCAMSCDSKRNGKADAIICYLEMKKFIVTTEINETFLLIKPMGYTKRIVKGVCRHYFCKTHKN